MKIRNLISFTILVYVMMFLGCAGQNKPAPDAVVTIRPYYDEIPAAWLQPVISPKHPTNNTVGALIEFSIEQSTNIEQLNLKLENIRRYQDERKKRFEQGGGNQ